MPRSFQIGHEYRDTGVGYKTDPEDEFQSWLTEPVPEGEPAFIPMKAMKPLRTYSDSSEIGDLAAFILVSDDRDTVYLDQLVLEEGKIKYWGDAKRQDSDEEIQISEFYGNKHLLSEAKKVERGRFERTSPILFFEKDRSGYVQFQGLCILEEVTRDKYKQSFDGTRVWTPNYLFHLAVLDADSVSLQWIHSRVKKGTDSHQPDVWERWKTTGEIRRRQSDEVSQNTKRRDINSEEHSEGAVYEYQVTRVQVSNSFRRRAFDLYDNECILTEIKENPLVTLSHIVPRSDEVRYAEDINNIMLLNWTHHVAFDSGIFTLDPDLHLWVNPEFETGDPWLQQTLLDRHGEKLELPEGATPSEERIQERNTSIDWWPPAR